MTGRQFATWLALSVSATALACVVLIAGGALAWPLVQVELVGALVGLVVPGGVWWLVVRRD